MFGYWLKCRDGVDLFASFHLSKIFPFNCLQKSRNIIYADSSDIMLNEGFDGVLSKNNWDNIWARDNEKSLVSESIQAYGLDNSNCLTVQSSSDKDWSISNNSLIEVQNGDVFYFEGYLKSIGRNNRCGFSVILYDKDKKVLQWVFAKKFVNGDKDWTKVTNKFLISHDARYIRFRFTGAGKGSSFADEIIFRKEVISYKPENLKSEYIISDDNIRMLICVPGNKVIVSKNGSNKKFTLNGFFGELAVVSVKSYKKDEIVLRAINADDLNEYAVKIIMMDNSRIAVEIDCINNEIYDSLEFPTFEIEKDLSLVLPAGEGILKPSSEVLGNYFRFRSGKPLPFVGLMKGDDGFLFLLDTPIDSEIVLDGKRGEKVSFTNRWFSEKAEFGYKRKIIFSLTEGGYTGLAKKYREYAVTNGLIKTLKNKSDARNRNIDKLIGAVDVWYWGKDARQFINDADKAGIKKILYSRSKDKADVDYINKKGFLSSSYDIYQDVWPPIYHDVTQKHDGWPEDLILDERGDWVKGWVIKKGLKEYPGGVICSIPGLERAKNVIPEDLKRKPYNARFIDTITSTPWRECCNKAHPTTRTEDMRNKMNLLDFCSNEMHLVTGAEDGAYTAIPYCDFFEGMMSPGIGRLPKSGRNVTGKRYAEPTKNFLEYQVGTKYRIPLWELVFHDCVVTTWYWGDSSNLINEVWYKRDLFNILYGNMPLWSIPDWNYWKKYKDRFIECYNNVCPVFEKVGYEEMLSHKFISKDQNIQETTFRNDVRIVVNFGEFIYKLEEANYELPAHGFVVFEKGKVWKEGVCS